MDDIERRRDELEPEDELRRRRLRTVDRDPSAAAADRAAGRAPDRGTDSAAQRSHADRSAAERAQAERAEAERAQAERALAERIERGSMREADRAEREYDELEHRDAKADEARDNLRANAGAERRVARTDRAQAHGLRGDADRADRQDGINGPDPSTNADRDRADWLKADGAHRDRLAARDERTADFHAAEPRPGRRPERVSTDRVSADRADRAQPPSPTDGSQPPAWEAVRQPPRQAPVARKNVTRRHRSPRQRGRGD